MNWWQSVQDAIRNVLTDLSQGGVDYLGRIVVSAVVLLIGVVLARLLAKLLQWILKQIRFDSLMDRLGLSDAMLQLGIRQKLSSIVPTVFFWIMVLVFTQTIARHMDLLIIAKGITGILSFLPNLLSAFLIIILAVPFGAFLSRAATSSARDSGVSFARGLGGLVHGVTIAVAAVIALGQLEVDTRILLILTVVVFSGFSIAFALTFGLGTRDATKNLIAGYYARRLFRIGQEVQIGNDRGILRSISATQTLVESEGKTAAIPNAVFLDQTVHMIGKG